LIPHLAARSAHGLALLTAQDSMNPILSSPTELTALFTEGVTSRALLWITALTAVLGTCRAHALYLRLCLREDRPDTAHLVRRERQFLGHPTQALLHSLFRAHTGPLAMSRALAMTGTFIVLGSLVSAGGRPIIIAAIEALSAGNGGYEQREANKDSQAHCPWES
jgi:hypothetical protein